MAQPIRNRIDEKIGSEVDHLLVEARQAWDQGQHRWAEALARRARCFDPASVAAATLQSELLRKLGRVDQALAITAQFLQTRDADLLATRAAMFCDLGRWDEARGIGDDLDHVHGEEEGRHEEDYEGDARRMRSAGGSQEADSVDRHQEAPLVRRRKHHRLHRDLFVYEGREPRDRRRGREDRKRERESASDVALDQHARARERARHPDLQRSATRFAGDRSDGEEHAGRRADRVAALEEVLARDVADHAK